MRFKTRLRVDKVPQLLRIAQVLDKVDRTVVLHLCAAEDDTVRLVLQSTAAASFSSFTTLKRTDWFEAYRIESQNDNQIGLELDMANLIRALRSATAADLVLIKLTKKGVPVLTFEIATPLGPIMQDIPVTVLSVVRLAEYQEPHHAGVPGFTLPPLAKLHTLVDRIKALSNSLHLQARVENSKATLSLRVRTDMVSVSSSFDDLTGATVVETHEPDHYEIGQSNNTFNAVVDIKNFSRCLHGHQVQPTHAVCFIHPSCVVVHLEVPSDVIITYYIPRRIDAT